MHLITFSVVLVSELSKLVLFIKKLEDGVYPLLFSEPCIVVVRILNSNLFKTSQVIEVFELIVRLAHLLDHLV